MERKGDDIIIVYQKVRNKRILMVFFFFLVNEMQSKQKEKYVEWVRFSKIEMDVKFGRIKREN